MTEFFLTADTVRIDNIRSAFAFLWKEWNRAGRPDDQMLELIGADFLADEPTIFGAVNDDYVARELAWYESKSLAVSDIPGGPPAIWAQVADSEGLINSNYGFLLNDRMGLELSQYEQVVAKLKSDINTRQAIAIYTRPSIHEEWNFDGGHDFICTNTVHYFIRDNRLHTIVSMRSNDAIFGFRNDYAWQGYVTAKLCMELKDTYPLLKVGKIQWQANSLHIYPRHFKLVEAYVNTGVHDGTV